MNERNPEEIENIFGENIMQSDNGMGFNNTIERDPTMGQSNEPQVNKNIEDVVQNYFTQPMEQVEPVQPIEQIVVTPMENMGYTPQPVEPEIAPVAPLPEVEVNPILDPVNPIDNVQQNFNLEDANRVTNEHPDAKITLNREEKEQTSNEIATMQDLITELKNNPSIKFILILGGILLVVIFALQYVSNLIK